MPNDNSKNLPAPAAASRAAEEEKNALKETKKNLKKWTASILRKSQYMLLTASDFISVCSNTEDIELIPIMLGIADEDKPLINHAWVEEFEKNKKTVEKYANMSEDKEYQEACQLLKKAKKSIKAIQIENRLVSIVLRTKLFFMKGNANILTKNPENLFGQINDLLEEIDLLLKKIKNNKSNNKATLEKKRETNETIGKCISDIQENFFKLPQLKSIRESIP
jgi:hypothetical protein